MTTTSNQHETSRNSSWAPSGAPLGGRAVPCSSRARAASRRTGRTHLMDAADGPIGGGRRAGRRDQSKSPWRFTAPHSSYGETVGRRRGGARRAVGVHSISPHPRAALGDRRRLRGRRRRRRRKAAAAAAAAAAAPAAAPAARLPRAAAAAAAERRAAARAARCAASCRRAALLPPTGHGLKGPARAEVERRCRSVCSKFSYRPRAPGRAPRTLPRPARRPATATSSSRAYRCPRRRLGQPAVVRGAAAGQARGEHPLPELALPVSESESAHTRCRGACGPHPEESTRVVVRPRIPPPPAPPRRPPLADPRRDELARRRRRRRREGRRRRGAPGSAAVSALAGPAAAAWRGRGWRGGGAAGGAERGSAPPGGGWRRCRAASAPEAIHQEGRREGPRARRAQSAQARRLDGHRRRKAQLRG